MNRLSAKVSIYLLVTMAVSASLWMRYSPDVSADAGTIVAASQDSNTVLVTIDAAEEAIAAGTISLTFASQQLPTCVAMENVICNVTDGDVQMTFVNPQGLTGQHAIAELSFKESELQILDLSVYTLVSELGQDVPYTQIVNGNTVAAQDVRLFLPLVAEGAGSSQNRDLATNNRAAAQADLIGDVTCDNNVNVIDALAIMQFVVALRTEMTSCPLISPTTTLNVTLGDVNNSNSVDAIDALWVMQCDVGMVNDLCSDEEPPNTEPSVFEIVSMALESEAIEATGQRAELILRRTGGNAAVDLSYSIGETIETSRTSASAEDMIIRDANGNAVNGTIEFAANQMEQKVTIEAVSDNNIEVPERFRFVLTAGSGYTVNPDASEKAMILRDDDPGVTEDSLLFVGLMEPEGSSITSASGIAIIRLSRDNSFGKVDYNFSGLTTVQTAAHIHYANPQSGPVIFSLPMGQVIDEKWDIQAAFTASTDQAMLDALLAGRLYLNAHSVRYPAGEIRGNAILTAGAPTMAPPQPPASIEPVTGDDLRRDIARFLNQATFGPTDATIADMEARVAANSGDRVAAFSEWLDEQMAVESPSLLEYYKAHNGMYVNSNAARNNPASNSVGVTEGWFTASVYSSAELRERIGFALSEIFVVSLVDANVRQNPWGISDFYDMLRDGAFGSYKDLLTDVSRHPAMGWYLSHIRNQSDQIGTDGELLVSPDQNYAREVLQLFSIGLINLHPDGSLRLSENGLPTRSYTQEDVSDLADAFTGWGFAVQNENDGDSVAVAENTDFKFAGHDWSTAEYHDSWITPLKMFETNGLPSFDAGYVRYHENREKIVMGHVFPAGQSGEQDMAQAMDMLANHPNTAPFISYRLIQRLVTSNPSAGYIYRVATTFSSTDGDLGAVVKAILLDPEARNLDLTNQIGYGKKKEPLVQAVAALRAVNAEPNGNANNSLTVLNGLGQEEIDLYKSDASIMFFSYAEFANGESSIGQSPLNAPTVFNFFKPNYSVIGAISEAGLVSPEFEQITDNRLIQNFDFYHNLYFNNQGVMGGRRTFNGTIMRITYDLPSWLTEPYMDIMDGDGDGDIDTQDNNFYSPSSIQAATQEMLDVADLYLCNGALRAESTGNMATDPYTIILDGLIQAHDTQDFTTRANAMAARDGRIRMLLYLMGVAPQCSIQK